MNEQSGIYRILAPLSKLCDLMILNLLFLLGCLPIVTVGASLSGMYYALFRFANEEGTVFKDYWHGFRSDFGKSTAGWLLLLVILFLVLENGWYLYVSGNLSTWILILFLTVLFLALAIGSYFFPLNARFQNTFGRTLNNSVIFALGHLPRTILLVILNNFILAICFFAPSTFLSMLIAVLAGGFSIPAYLSVLILKKVFAPFSEIPGSNSSD